MRFIIVSSAAMACGLVAGCANDGTNTLTTGAVSKQQVATAPVDPACLALQNRIALLRQEGTIGRVEKAATGKSKTVVVKRSALTKVAEFNQANAEFQARCSKLPRTAQATVQGGQATASQAKAAAATVKKP